MSMILFELPDDFDRRTVAQRLRIYARQIRPDGGGLRLIALLEEAAIDLDLAAGVLPVWTRRPPA